MSKDEIKIHFPSKIPDELKEVSGLSDAMKSHIAKKIEEGNVKIQSYIQDGVVDSNEKCELILELLQERAKFDKYITIDEVKEIMDEEENYLSNFVVGFMKLGRERSMKIKKIRKQGKTAYKLVN